MKLGIVGCGVVGSAMARLFLKRSNHDVVIYDKFLPSYDSSDRRLLINTCELVFLCVPTPLSSDGCSCDLSAVEECIDWISPPICIRSTIIPGTVERLSAASGKRIAFSPEYLGEQANHPWHEEASCGFMIVGGPEDLCALIVSVYDSIPGLSLQSHKTTSRTAELCKYMENSFLAVKVAFVNQFFDIAASFDVSFDALRDLWLADPRIGPSHSIVTPERGFRGRCLPKDLLAIIAAMQPFGGAPLLEAIASYNRQLCQRTDALPVMDINDSTQR